MESENIDEHKLSFPAGYEYGEYAETELMAMMKKNGWVHSPARMGFYIFEKKDRIIWLGSKAWIIGELNNGMIVSFRSEECLTESDII